MVLAAATPLIDSPHVLPLPGVPRSPKLALERAQILSRIEQSTFQVEDAETMQICSVGTFHAFKPQNAWYEWLSHRVAIQMIRIDRAERIERRLRDLQALRAIDCWELDQVRAAEALGADLALDPQRVVAELWCTPAGCNWMIEKWESLAATPADDWTEAQVELAHQIDPTTAHFYQTPGYVRMRILNLEVMRDRLKAADESLRKLTESDLSPVPSKLLAEVRKYARSLHRQMKWYVTQLRIEPPNRNQNLNHFPNFVPNDIRPEPTAPSEATADDRTNPSSDPMDSQIDRTNPISDPILSETDRTNPILPRD